MLPPPSNTLTAARCTMTHLDETQVKQLAENCIFENARYKRQKASDSTQCFSLLQEAFAKQNPLALEQVHSIYLDIMEKWANLYIGSQNLDEDAEYFATEAFNRFYFYVRGDVFNEKFQSLPQVLRFMQVCVLNAILGHQRKNPRPPLPLLEDFDVEDPTATPGGDEEALWKHICKLLPNPQHQLLARLAFILDMKPREIIEIEAYRDIWNNVRNLSMSLYRIRLILRADDTLRNWLDND
jgi:hypothetical protein